MPRTKVALLTFGCKVNTQDSNEWSAWLEQHDVEMVELDADLVLINSCTVTDKADRETVAVIRKLKKENPGVEIIVTGCGARQKRSVYHIPEVTAIVQHFSEREKIVPYLPQKTKTVLPRDTMQERTRALITIQEGCDTFCYFCIVPMVRGPSSKREMGEILSEIQHREQEGYQEIVLTGINIGAYGCSNTNHTEESKFAELLDTILRKTSIPRIRLTSFNPQFFSHELVALFQNPRLCNHLHLSLQSGSDAILQKMKRDYTVERTLEYIRILERQDPFFSFNSDMIVGYPGETEEDFALSCALAEEVPLAKIHVFPYSVRAGTAAARMTQVPEQTKKKRAAHLRGISQRLREKFQLKMVGQILEVLFEKKMHNPYLGWSRNYCEVVVPSAVPLYNTIRTVRITRVEGEKLVGELL